MPLASPTNTGSLIARHTADSRSHSRGTGLLTHATDRQTDERTSLNATCPYTFCSLFIIGGHSSWAAKFEFAQSHQNAKAVTVFLRSMYFPMLLCVFPTGHMTLLQIYQQVPLSLQAQANNES